MSCRSPLRAHSLRAPYAAADVRTFEHRPSTWKEQLP